MSLGAYSIIEQGRVDVLLQASTKDRRTIFEMRIFGNLILKNVPRVGRVAEECALLPPENRP